MLGDLLLVLIILLSLTVTCVPVWSCLSTRERRSATFFGSVKKEYLQFT